MACQISFKERFFRLNNVQFARLIDFSLQIAEATALPEEREFVERLKRMDREEFFPGRGLEIERDFPTGAERKFWSRVCYDTSRAIFDRSVGAHEHSFWQAQAIHQAYSAGLLFEEAVRESEPQWLADTVDRREFDKVVNGIER